MKNKYLYMISALLIGSVLYLSLNANKNINKLRDFAIENSQPLMCEYSNRNINTVYKKTTNYTVLKDYILDEESQLVFKINTCFSVPN